MISIPKSNTFVKELSIQFLEDSKEFKDAPVSKKQEYIRQYEVVKQRFLQKLLGETVELGNENQSTIATLAKVNRLKTSKVVTKAESESLNDLKQKEIRSLAKAVTGTDSSNMTESDNFIFLYNIVDSELKEKENVLSVFKTDNTSSENTRDESAQISKDSILIQNKSLQGNTESAKIAEVMERDKTVFENFESPSSTDSSEIVFDSITQITENTQSQSSQTLLLKEILENESPSSIEDDSKVIMEEPRNLVMHYLFPSLEDKIRMISTRYNTEDSVFFSLYPLPEKFEHPNIVEDIKTNLSASLIGEGNTSDSLELIKDEKEDFIKLSVGTVIEFIMNRNVLDNLEV